MSIEAKRLADYIKKNYGATIKNLDVYAYTSGYQVGFKANSASVSEDMLEETIDFYLENYDEFGAWFNEDENLYDIDVGTNVEDLNEALSRARKEDQIAIWDWANEREIMVEDA